MALLDHCKYHKCKVHISSCIFHEAGRTDSFFFLPFYVVIIPPSESEGEPSSFAARWESAGTRGSVGRLLIIQTRLLSTQKLGGGLKKRKCELRSGVCLCVPPSAGAFSAAADGY